MNQKLIHPDMVDRLGRFFPDTCTIQEKTQSGTDSMGNPEYTWADKFADVNCAIGKDTSQEVRQEDKTVVKSTHRIALMGLYGVTKAMRVVANGNTYNILLPQEDEQSTMTALVCEKVEI